MTKNLAAFFVLIFLCLSQPALSTSGTTTTTSTGQTTTTAPIGTGVQVGTGGTGTTVQTNTGQVTGGSCDYSAIKESLYQTESNCSGGGYKAICTSDKACGRGSVECEGGARGKYQFTRATRSSYINKAKQCNGSACNTDTSWISESCHQVQECIMDAYLAESQDRIKNSSNCQQLLHSTKTFSGKHGGQTLICTPSESGILAAMHLGGNGNDSVCRRILNGTGPSDQLGTGVTGYMCKHKNLPVPNNCTPAPYDPSVDQPIATQTQIEALEEQGIPYEDIPQGSPDPLRDYWLHGLMQMAEQFTANMALQVQMVGQLFDAKHQLETQRLFQQKTAEAHKDYQPSEQMCTFGTFTRDLVATSRSADLTKAALANDLLQRDVGSGDSKGVSPGADSLSRITQFRTKFCNPDDNGKGLSLFCPSPPSAELANRDIDYTRTVDQPLSLDINLADTTQTPDEDAVFALIDNLFAHDPLPRVSPGVLDQRRYQYAYFNLRSLIAMRGVARASISNLIALKTATPNKNDGTAAPHMKALLREFGLQDEEIEKLLGKNPSYYAQMELLTKKIYQNPYFYTNLYDKPANVTRIRAAMTAVKLMQDRDISAALQRREMLLSILLEIRLRERADAVYNAAEDAFFDRSPSNR